MNNDNFMNTDPAEHFVNRGRKRRIKIILGACLLVVGVFMVFVGNWTAKMPYESHLTDEENTMKEEITMNFEYEFKAENSTDKIPAGSSLICNIIDGFPEDYQDQTVLTYGRLKTLFGEPLYESENLEDQYCYCITATKDGNTLYIYAYSGSSGPAIGGLQDEESAKAATELVKLIEQAQPTDYDYVGYYMDAPCKVEQGVKNGIPYTKQEMLNLSDEEFSELYRRVYGL